MSTCYGEAEKHLIGLAVTMTRGCQICTRSRFEKARAAGIGDDMLNAPVDVVTSVNAGVTAARPAKGSGSPPPRRSRRAPTSATPRQPRLERMRAIEREWRVASFAAGSFGKPLRSWDPSGEPTARSPLPVPAR